MVRAVSVVAIAAGANAAQDGLTLAGRIVGERADEFRLIVDHEEVHAPAGAIMRVEVARVAADGDGRFAVSGLAPGHYNLKLLSHHHAYEERSLVVLRSRRDVELRLGPAGVLRAEIELEVPGAPEQLDVRAAPLNAPNVPGRHFDVDAAGRFVAWNLSPGDYAFRMTQRSGPTYRFFRRIVPGEQREVFTLRPTAPVELVTVPPPGRERASGRVTLRDSQGRVLERSRFRVRRDGDALVVDDGSRAPGARPSVAGDPTRLTLGRLPAGSYVLEVDGVGCESVEHRFEHGDEPSSVRVPLRRTPGQFVTASVDARFWRVIADGAAEPLIWQDARSMPTHALPAGTVLGFLAPGRYRLRLETDRYASGPPVEVVVRDGAELMVLQFDRFEGSALTGTVESQRGERLKFLLVYLWRREAGRWVAVRAKTAGTGSDGTFEFTGVRPGHYRVSLDEAGARTAAEFEVGDADRALQVVLRDDGSVRLR